MYLYDRYLPLEELARELLVPGSPSLPTKLFQKTT